jgi:ADP-ribosyl-[dinitrogen reductase] hydrolase
MTHTEAQRHILAALFLMIDVPPVRDTLTTPAQVDRFHGCLFGLAVGDAVGSAVEFMAPGTFPPVEDMIGGGPFGLEPGQWTDDTSMALCLAESLIECGGFNPADQMQRYLRWYRTGHLSSTGRCFDIGVTVAEALHRFESTGEPFSGSPDPRKAGNGSLMRLAPVAMFYWRDLPMAIERAAESSRTTHQALAAVDACRYFCALLVGALHGAAKDSLLAGDYWASGPLAPEIQEIASGSFKRRNPPEIVGSGYVVRSLEAALWAFYRTDTYRDGCLLAANLGNDADTTAAIYGQLAGAYYGLRGIPATWISRLAERELINSYSARLLQHGDLTPRHRDTEE